MSLRLAPSLREGEEAEGETGGRSADRTGTNSLIWMPNRFGPCHREARARILEERGSQFCRNALWQNLALLRLHCHRFCHIFDVQHFLRSTKPSYRIFKIIILHNLSNIGESFGICKLLLKFDPPSPLREGERERERERTDKQKTKRPN